MHKAHPDMKQIFVDYAFFHAGMKPPRHAICIVDLFASVPSMQLSVLNIFVLCMLKFLI